MRIVRRRKVSRTIVPRSHSLLLLSLPVSLIPPVSSRESLFFRESSAGWINSIDNENGVVTFVVIENHRDEFFSLSLSRRARDS